MSDRLQQCPACGEDAHTPVESARGFDVVRCEQCGLAYTANPHVDLRSYGDTYDGEPGFLADPTIYAAPAARLSLEQDAFIRLPPYLTPSEQWVLKRITTRVPQGAIVLDIGCGTGRILIALSRSGYRAIGVDPVEHVITNLRNKGCDARVGSMPGLEWDAPPPDVVTLFEVLEHLPDPGPVLAEIRDRFPNARVGVTVPSPTRVALRRGRAGADYPPNHFLRWTQTALERAFTRAGFRAVSVVAPHPNGTELVPGAANLVPLQILRSLARRRASVREGGESHQAVTATSDESATRTVGRRLIATGLIVSHRAWRTIASVAGTPSAFIAARRGWSSASLALWAEP